MLFISNNKKIDTVIKKLQPSLKLKINIERDFDCGLNNVFEKRPDVVFIQNQIAGVTGESVARHIQLLLGGVAPKFIFIHDGDAKAKPKKGLYDYLIDLSQNEESVAADILGKLNLLLGPQWQNIFGTSVFQGVDYEALTPGTEPIEQDTPPTASPLLPLPETGPNKSCDVIPATSGQLSEIIFEECGGGGPTEAKTVSVNNFTSGEIISSSAAEISFINSELSAVLPETSNPTVTGATVVSGKAERSKPVVVESTDVADLLPSPPKDSPPPLSTVLIDQNPFVSLTANPVAAEKLQTRPSSLAGRGGVPEEMPPVVAEEALQWVFEGEPSLKKSTWKWYQVVELILVLCLLLGGWYFIKQKQHSSEPVAKEVNLIASASSPPITPQSVPAAQQPLPVALPSFIPIAGLDPIFATQNPGWERYVGAGSEFRLFRENGKLKAVQVKADKGRVISDSLLKTILVELTGTGEYRVKSREKKLGFLVVNAIVNGKAELLIYSKKSSLHALVVSLD